MNMLSTAQNQACMNEVLDAAEVFVEIVIPKVDADRLDERSAPSASQEKAKASKAKTIDVRPVRLMSVSGKGGYSKDPARAAHFAQWANISLLDHLVSVARGAAVVVALEYANAKAASGFAPGASMDMPRLLGLTMAVGFLHDANKCLDRGVRNNTQVSDEEIGLLVSRYGIDEFLSVHGWPCLPAAEWAPLLRQLVRGSEVNQSDEEVLCACEDAETLGRSVGAALTAGDVEIAVRAVRRADRLDGAWLKSGVDGLLRELKEMGNETLGSWSTLVLREPHLPFLLDRLLLALERQCVEETGLPPLVLSHMDGELVALLPSSLSQGFFLRAFDHLKSLLPFGLDIKLNNKKGLAIIGGKPSWEDLIAYVKGVGQRQDVRQSSELMAVHKDFATPASFALLRASWAAIGLGHLIGSPTTATVGKYDALIPSSQVKVLLEQSSMGSSPWNELFAPLQALIAALLGEPGTSRSCLVPVARLAAFEAFLDRQGWTVPEGLGWENSETFTNAVRLVFWAVPQAVLAGKTDELWAFGQALMSGYSPDAPQELEAHTVGLTALFPSAWQDQALDQLIQRWESMVSGDPVVLPVETAGPRCLFLDVPLPESVEAIGSEFGLYQVKASAFSGRSGRPDNLTSAPRSPCNFISPVMRLEHALRQADFSTLGHAGKGVALTVSTPLRFGLFAGVQSLSDEVASFESKPKDVSTYELLTQDPKKRFVETRHLVVEQVLPKTGYRLSRFESLPSRMENRLDFYLRWAQAARRFGRPVHLFRGLPRAMKAFFSIDTVSGELEGWLGGREWRLEQLPELIERLRLGVWALDKSKGGPGLAWFQRLLDPSTQWVVAAWLLNRNRFTAPDDPRMPAGSEKLLQTIFDNFLGNPMSPSTAPVMQQLASLNAAFQKIQGAFYKLSNNERSLVWNGARDLWEKHRDNHLAEAIPASEFVAGGLIDLLSRKGKLVDSANARVSVEEFSRLFVAHAPQLVKSPDLRQALTGAYVHLFEKAVAEYWRRRNEESSSTDSL